MSILQLKLKDKLIDLTTPIVMGVVNVTPDSFYSGNRFTNNRSSLKCVENIIEEGGSIVDIGAYSTRPQAEDITADEEIRRLSNCLDLVLKKFPDTIISVDTFRANVARYVVENYGVSIINDISGGSLDNTMFETIADLKVAYVLMHTRGNPKTMNQLTTYDDLISEIMHFFEKRLTQLRLLGVNDVLIDPGFGFAKNIEQNYELLHKLSYFNELNVPILAGLSRKSMIYKLLDISANEALNGTTATNMLALMGGASVLRVHDVKEAMQTINIYKQYKAVI